MTGTAWQRLSDLGACRVTQIPRRPGGRGPGQPGSEATVTPAARNAPPR